MDFFDSVLTSEMFFVVILSIFLFLLACAGIAVFITYRILKKHNDFGEVICNIHQYSNEGIKFNVNRDNVLIYEKNEYMLIHGENPYEGIERSIPEQLLKNNDRA